MSSKTLSGKSSCVIPSFLGCQMLLYTCDKHASSLHACTSNARIVKWVLLNSQIQNK